MVRAIQKRVVYPRSALRDILQGQCQVSFAVSPTGQVGQIRITRSLEPEMDAAVIAAVRQLPQLEPATQFGKPVACLMTAPITFLIDYPLKVKKPLPAADSLQLFSAVRQMPLYRGKLGFVQMADDLVAEYLRLQANTGCFVPRTNLGILVTVGPGGTLYDLQVSKPNQQAQDDLRAEYGDAVVQQEEEELPAACTALLAQAAQHLPRLAPAYANGQRVATRLQLTLLASPTN
ncbi:hypothetical protein GCM10027044_12290 [Hymenobacter ruber]